MYWIGAILAIGLLIVVHEAGHYFVARWCKMRVERFSIGFGPALTGWRSKKTGTFFQIAPIPFGGFVEIKGMNIVEEVDPDDHSAYPNRPAWQRFVTIFAGPATNYLTAVVLALVLFTFAGISQREVYYGVHSIDDGYAAKQVLEPHDRILALNGTKIWWNGPNDESVSLQETLKASQHPVDPAHPPAKDTLGEPVTLSILRDGTPLDVKVQPKFDDTKDIMAYRLGVHLDQQADRAHVGPVGVVTAAFRYPVDKTGEILSGFYQIIFGHAKAYVAGPGGMAEMVKDAFVLGWVDVFELMMMLNVYLGLFNLLPLPALDGGRLVFLGYEMATRRRPNPRVEATVHMVGILILAVIMVLVTFKDCVHIAGG
ncbi:MAG TPA: M50 family metallopeptidase [Kofleriaceae bacterium]|nr:M50 family metallopeptidase [Kofleriaceae bacterium]